MKEREWKQVMKMIKRFQKMKGYCCTAAEAEKENHGQTAMYAPHKTNKEIAASVLREYIDFRTGKIYVWQSKGDSHKDGMDWLSYMLSGVKCRIREKANREKRDKIKQGFVVSINEHLINEGFESLTLETETPTSRVSQGTKQKESRFKLMLAHFSHKLKRSDSEIEEKSSAIKPIEISDDTDIFAELRQLASEQLGIVV